MPADSVATCVEREQTQQNLMPQLVESWGAVQTRTDEMARAADTGR